MTALTISAKGWVVIPAELRARYNLKPGKKVRIVDYGGVLAIVPIADNPIDYTAGMLKGGRSLTLALREERKRDLEREERKLKGK